MSQEPKGRGSMAGGGGGWGYGFGIPHRSSKTATTALLFEPMPCTWFVHHSSLRSGSVCRSGVA